MPFPMRFSGSIVGATAVLAAATLLPGAAAAAPPAGHVVLIVVDGLRPDAIAAAPAPHIGRLQAGAAHTLGARAVGTPETLPSLVTMVTSRSPAAHGVTYNTDRGGALAMPTVFTRVHEAGGASALYFGKSKLTMLAAPDTAAVRRGPGPNNKDWDAGDDATLAQAFARDFPEHRFRFTLIHLRDPDFVGHDAGWMSAAYLAAVRRADEAVGVIVGAIAGSAVAPQTAVLLTSDHGGEGTRHWSGSEVSWTIPWLCRAPGARAGPIRGQVTLLDVAPTALALLGLPPLPGAEGRVVEACARPRS
jgi:arylsulfatase A-like enzyme